MMLQRNAHGISRTPPSVTARHPLQSPPPRPYVMYSYHPHTRNTCRSPNIDNTSRHQPLPPLYHAQQSPKKNSPLRANCHRPRGEPSQYAVSPPAPNGASIVSHRRVISGDDIRHLHRPMAFPPERSPHHLPHNPLAYRPHHFEIGGKDSGIDQYQNTPFNRPPDLRRHAHEYYHCEPKARAETTSNIGQAETSEEEECRQILVRPDTIQGDKKQWPKPRAHSQRLQTNLVETFNTSNTDDSNEGKSEPDDQEDAQNNVTKSIDHNEMYENALLLASLASAMASPQRNNDKSKTEKETLEPLKATYESPERSPSHQIKKIQLAVVEAGASSPASSLSGNSKDSQAEEIESDPTSPAQPEEASTQKPKIVTPQQRDRRFLEDGTDDSAIQQLHHRDRVVAFPPPDPSFYELQSQDIRRHHQAWDRSHRTPNLSMRRSSHAQNIYRRPTKADVKVIAKSGPDSPASDHAKCKNKDEKAPPIFRSTIKRMRIDNDEDGRSGSPRVHPAYHDYMAKGYVHPSLCQPPPPPHDYDTHSAPMMYFYHPGHPMYHPAHSSAHPIHHAPHTEPVYFDISERKSPISSPQEYPYAPAHHTHQYCQAKKQRVKEYVMVPAKQAPSKRATNQPIRFSPAFHRAERGNGRKIVISKGNKWAWKDYPELEKFLIDNRDDYLRHSAMNYTNKQKEYNNDLTERMLVVAEQNDYEFDSTDFDFVAVRDRIRCYYKSYVQSNKKKGRIVSYPPLRPKKVPKKLKVKEEKALDGDSNNITQEATSNIETDASSSIKSKDTTVALPMVSSTSS